MLAVVPYVKELNFPLQEPEALKVTTGRREDISVHTPIVSQADLSEKLSHVTSNSDHTIKGSQQPIRFLGWGIFDLHQ